MYYKKCINCFQVNPNSIDYQIESGSFLSGVKYDYTSHFLIQKKEYARFKNPKNLYLYFFLYSYILNLIYIKFYEQWNYEEKVIIWIKSEI